MRQAHTSSGSPEGGRYAIRLKGHLDTHWTAWFDGLTFTHESDGTTLLRGELTDQAALHGLLQRIRDLGLPLVSVTEVPPDRPVSVPPTSPTTNQEFPWSV
jgi:hypothetical protein